MKVYYECAPCFMRQAREALDLATDDEELKLRVMEKILELLNERFTDGMVSNEIGTAVHRLIKEMTGIKDPYLPSRGDPLILQGNSFPWQRSTSGNTGTLKATSGLL